MTKNKIKDIICLTESQYTELSTNGQIIIDGETLVFDPNKNIYVTPEGGASNTALPLVKRYLHKVTISGNTQPTNNPFYVCIFIYSDKKARINIASQLQTELLRLGQRSHFMFIGGARQGTNPVTYSISFNEDISRISFYGYNDGGYFVVYCDMADAVMGTADYVIDLCSMEVAL